MVKFIHSLFEILPRVLVMKDADIILAVLSLIDLSLAGNLLIIVIFSGYENFGSLCTCFLGDQHFAGNWFDGGGDAEEGFEGGVS